jgi:hypothetical protein
VRRGLDGGVDRLVDVLGELALSGTTSTEDGAEEAVVLGSLLLVVEQTELTVVHLRGRREQG